jgi:hypothetical protein
MTVVVLPERPLRDRPPGPRHTVLERSGREAVLERSGREAVLERSGREASNHRRLAEPATLTLSFNVTLTGENRYSDAAEVLDTLRQVTDRLATADVSVAPPLTLVESTVDESVRPELPEPVLVLADSREVRLGERMIPFTRIEFDLLLFLAEHPRQVFSREQLLQRVWGFARGGGRTVDVHIRRLRAKLGERDVATTVRGVGYRLADAANVRVVRLSRALITAP